MLNANKARSEIASARDDELEALLARGPAVDAGIRKMAEQEKMRRASRMTPMSAAQPTPRFAAGGLMAPKDSLGQSVDMGRPELQNDDGTFSTEETITVTDPRINDGAPTNIPSIWGGKRAPSTDPADIEEYAVQGAIKSGQTFPAYKSIDEAVSAAQQRSNELESIRRPRFAAGGLMAPPQQAPASPPPGAMPNEVADNVDAKLSEGEFVLPANVVRYIGLEKLMQMRDKAMKGLGAMQEKGQIQQAPAATQPAPASPQVKMAQGGLVGGPPTTKEEARKQQEAMQQGEPTVSPMPTGPVATTKEEARKQASLFTGEPTVGPANVGTPAQNMALVAPNQDDYTRASTAAGMPLETYTDRFGRIGYRTPGSSPGALITAPVQYTPNTPSAGPTTPSLGGSGGTRPSTGINPPSLTSTVLGGVATGLGVAGINAGVNTVADVVGGTPVGTALRQNFVDPVTNLTGGSTPALTALGNNAINAIGTGTNVIGSFSGVPTQTVGQIAASPPAATGSLFNPNAISDSAFQVGSTPATTTGGGASFGGAGTGASTVPSGPSWASGTDALGRPGFFQNTTANTVANAGLGIAGGLAGNFVGGRVGNAIGSDRLGGSYGGAIGGVAGSVAARSLAAIPGMQFMAIPGVGEFFGATLGRVIGGFIGANPTRGLRSSTEVAVVNGQLTNTGLGVDPGIRNGKNQREVVPKIEDGLKQLNTAVLNSIDHIVRDVGGTLTDGKMVSIGIRNGNEGPLKTGGDTKYVTSTDINYTWDGYKKAQDKGDMFDTADQAIAAALVRAIDSGMITGGDTTKLQQYRTDLHNFAFGQPAPTQTQPALPTGLGASRT